MGDFNRVFGTNGIRGLVNEELTLEFALRISEAIGAFFKTGSILVGYDGRTSSAMLVSAVISGLISTGCNVYEAGLTPTPCLQYAIKNHKMDGGVMITASHNPPEYNGIKVMGKDGVEIPRNEEVEIECELLEERVSHVNWQRIGRKSVLHGILSEYKEAVKRHANAAAIAEKNYNVVVDSANGVGALVAPYLLRELGCKVTTINADIDGTFPSRMPEPRPENLHELVAAVKATGSDFGVAFDGDADRSIFVDEKGDVQWGDRTFALIEKDYLQANAGETVVTPVSSSQVIRDVAEKHGGELVWTEVGSTIVSHNMKKLKANLGGEENGGVFYGPHQPVRDAAMTTVLVLNIMAKTAGDLSSLLNEMPKYHLEKDKLRCPNNLKPLVLEKLVEAVQHLNPQTIDGVKLWFPGKRAILIRPSGTEPVYRFYAEARSKEEASDLVNKYKQKLGQIINSM